MTTIITVKNIVAFIIIKDFIQQCWLTYMSFAKRILVL